MWLDYWKFNAFENDLENASIKEIQISGYGAYIVGSKTSELTPDGLERTFLRGEPYRNTENECNEIFIVENVADGNEVPK